jgi:hypothetical protein
MIIILNSSSGPKAGGGEDVVCIVSKIKENAMKAQDVLARARLIGRGATVDAVPDPTAEGFDQWREDILRYFIPTLERFLSAHQAEALRDQVVTAMREGFVELVISQPYVDVPLQPMEPLPRNGELHLIEEVFDGLRLASVH